MGMTALPRRRLGRTELNVTCFALGGAGYGHPDLVSDRDAIETVQLALDNGINYIDTSPLYGESERRVGLALQGIPRKSYILSTKTGTHPARRGDYSWEGTLWSVENSLSLLKTDRVDLVLVHDPRDEQEMDAIFGPKGAAEALEYLKAERVIGAIGLGQRMHSWHRRAIESGRFDVILTYNDYHPIRGTALTGGLLDLAQRHDVGVINGSPLAHGLLNGRDPQSDNAAYGLRFPAADVEAARRLYDWCAREGLPMLAVTLQFCLRQPLIACTLTGAKSPSELAENLQAIRTPLPPDVWTALEKLNLAM